MGGKIKKLKFSKNLVPLILSGEKTTTWRFFDDKDLRVDDEIVFVNQETGEEFAKVKITSVREKEFKDASDTDLEGHEKFENKEKMLEQYRKYYGDKVDWDTIVKIIKFKIV